MATYRFFVDKFEPIPGKEHHYRTMTLEAEGPDKDQAFEKIKQQVPEGHRVFCVFVWSLTTENGS